MCHFVFLQPPEDGRPRAKEATEEASDFAEQPAEDVNTRAKEEEEALTDRTRTKTNKRQKQPQVGQPLPTGHPAAHPTNDDQMKAHRRRRNEPNKHRRKRSDGARGLPAKAKGNDGALPSTVRRTMRQHCSDPPTLVTSPEMDQHRRQHRGAARRPFV